MSHSTSSLLDKHIINDIQSRFHTFDEFLTSLSSFIKDCSNLSDVAFTISGQNFSYSELLQMLCRIIRSDISEIESHITPVKH